MSVVSHYDLAMSLYYLSKFIFELNRDTSLQARFTADMSTTLHEFELTNEERQAVIEPDIGLLYVLGVNGQILMHYAAFRGIEWFDYLEAMREGIEKHGPVREGLYAMTGDGKLFV